MRLPHALLAAAALLLSVPAAQALTIDDFSVDQIGFIAPGGPFFQESLGAVPAGIGGSRELYVTRDGVGSIEFVSSGGIGSFGSAPSVDGFAELFYDGVSDGLFGLDLAADLTDAGASGALRVVFRSDVVGPMSISIASTGGTSVLHLPTPGLGLTAGFTTVVVPFTSFVATSGGGANFASVGRILIDIDSEFIGHDLQIDLIDTVPVPEPTTAALLGLGLALAAGVARRRSA
jgi:hypothetical protein